MGTVCLLGGEGPVSMTGWQCAPCKRVEVLNHLQDPIRIGTGGMPNGLVVSPAGRLMFTVDDLRKVAFSCDVPASVDYVVCDDLVAVSVGPLSRQLTAGERLQQHVCAQKRKRERGE